MSQSCHTLTRAVAACVCIFSFTTGLRAQGSVLQLPGPWPTGWAGCATCAIPSPDAFQILYGSGGVYCPIPDAALRLSIYGGCYSPIFGQLAVVDTLHYSLTFPRPAEWFSAFAPLDATVLRSAEGDLILSATTFLSTPTHGPLPPATASIRFGTTPSDTLTDTADHPADIERAEILGNGNFGIDLPPDSIGLGNPLEQVQIGGGFVAPIGYTAPIPGLTLYGGNRNEGMPKLGGGFYPVDWRGLVFNHYEDHTTGIGSRFAPMSWSGIQFSDGGGGLINLSCFPWHTGDSLTDSYGGTTLSLTGTNGLEFLSDESHKGGSIYHHLFDCWRPGFLAYGVTRNQYGLFYHRTPVYIGIDSGASADFTNLAHVHPAIGDDSTWLLAVNGPALFKEAFVSLDWPDFVFLPNYNLMPLPDVEKYVEENHHLPGVPSAEEMKKTGIPLGATEATMMQKIEELTKYAIEQEKAIQELQSEVQELKNQKGR